MSLQAFILYALTGPGVGAILAAAFELLPYGRALLAALSYDQRRLMLLALCLAVPLAAQAFLVYAQGQPAAAEAWFAALSAGFAGYTTSQVAHLVARKGKAA